MNKTDTLLFMMIATLFAQPDHSETTVKMNAAKRKLFKWVRSIRMEKYNADVAEANAIWDAVKAEQDDPSTIGVSLSLMITILYDMIQAPKHKRPLTPRVVESACGSMAHGFVLTPEVEATTVKLSNAFRDKLGIEERATVKSLRSRIALMRNDAILTKG